MKKQKYTREEALAAFDSGEIELEELAEYYDEEELIDMELLYSEEDILYDPAYY